MLLKMLSVSPSGLRINAAVLYMLFSIIRGKRTSLKSVCLCSARGREPWWLSGLFIDVKTDGAVQGKS